MRDTLNASEAGTSLDIDEKSLWLVGPLENIMQQQYICF